MPHLLLTHLNDTSKRAEIFAKKFQSEEWGKVLGLVHDMGKGRVACIIGKYGEFLG